VTPIGSRVMRRDYGSALFDLIDQPANLLTKLRLSAAIAMALMRWEPRVTLKKIDLQRGRVEGQWILELETLRNDAAPASAAERMTIPLRFKAAAPPTVRPAYA
ncbi:MAG: GPW/gp25 family protein, partial [Phenylobacterium sp.]